MCKIKAYLIILIAFISTGVKAQDFWEELPFPDSLDIACLAVNQQGVLFVGTVTNSNYNGVYRSSDSGQTWVNVLNTGSLQIYSMAISDEGNIYISTGGFDPFRYSSDNGDSWQSLNFPAEGGGITKILCSGFDTLMIGLTLNNGSAILRSPDLGMTWDTLFLSSGPASEFVSDIVVSPSGDIFFSLMAFFQGSGGVYKSDDNGNSWQLEGLYDCQITDLVFNKPGDLFIGLFGAFVPIESTIYAIYNDNPEIVSCPIGCTINGMVINSGSHIYAGCSAWQAGLLRSLNNGSTFEILNTEYSWALQILDIDSQDYLYATTNPSSSYLLRSIDPTYTSVPEPEIGSKDMRLLVAPNPVTDYLKVSLNSSLKTETENKLEIIDLAGGIITSRSIQSASGNMELDVSQLKPGFYMLRLENSDSSCMSKFIKN